MSVAQPAINTLVKRGDGGSPETFTTTALVSSIQGLSLSAMVQDVTTHSNGTPWREKITTLLDAGELKFDLLFVPTDPTHSASAGLLSDMLARVKRNFKLVFPDPGATTWDFAAYVSKFDMQDPVDNVLKASVTLSATGQPTLRG